jgi:hypothetical protein
MINLYFDMDGVLAKWDTNDTTEDTFQKGYFLNREPDYLMIDLVLDMVKQPNINVSILSAVYDNGYALDEKKQWLIDNGLQNIPLINTPIGHDKAESVDQTVQSFLIDDYSKNLHRWESHTNFRGIKYYNGINGNNGSWLGDSLASSMSLEDAKNTLIQFLAI